MVCEMNALVDQIAAVRRVRANYPGVMDRRDLDPYNDALLTLQKLEALRIKMIASAERGEEDAFDSAALDLMEVLGIESAT